jgi:phage terminase Nu1 subunit (DNA packaging protein)
MLSAAVAEKITRAEYARRRGWSRAYVTQLVQAGRLLLDEGGRLDPDEADAALAAARDPSTHPQSTAGAHLAGEMAAPGLGRGRGAEGASAGPTYMQARTLREAYQAKLAELEYRERSGQLLDRAAAEAESLALGRELRETLLVLPPRLAQALAESSDPHECEAILEAALLEALETLASGR